MVKVSVILPNYNHERYLKQRLDSVFNQSFQDFEVILLDDASTDGSLEILEPYKNHPKVSHFMVNTTNSGSPFKAWRQGIELAKGDYVWIAESDDFAEPQFLEQTVAVLENSPMASLVYTDSQIVDGNTTKMELWSQKKNVFFKTSRWSDAYMNAGSDELIHYLLYKTTINNASAVLFRNKYLKAKPFLNTLVTYKNAGDIFTYIYMSFQGDIAYIGSALNNFRMHSANVTKVNMESGIVYHELMHIYSYALDGLFLNPIMVDPLKIRKACKAILGTHGFRLVDKQYLTSLIGFIKKGVAHGLFTKKEGLVFSLLYRMYGFKIPKLKGLLKHYLKFRLNRD
ncbi:glycosyltransferase family 2 protein [Confluentibacter flavum]|uniref:Glycosyl transferase family 1 n=1 Tax=Confluentibacter flavum TaxID=1909700 RepID=A0A2N3HP35_9FLAO|nr:glycosyltransferase [Confluentibacter flavum]PKQ46716.1 glycosyl transferase family 1 [Confluentibacter flavum]